MDSVTQFVLGAAVGMAVSGAKLGARKAALIGGVLGTLPDLDTFYPFDNPVDNFVLHRGATHSLIVHTAIAPVAGAVLARLSNLRTIHAIALVWLIWATHALLDAMTIYGTQLLWPVSTYPYGSGSLFIIDPLYTLPLLVLCIGALFIRDWGSRIERLTAGALIVSTLYVGWSLFAQNHIRERAQSWLVANGWQAERLLITPMPLNTLFWRAIAIDGAAYLNLYIPILGDNDTIYAYRHRRLDPSGICALALPEGQRLDAFAGGFVKALQMPAGTVVSDLRMGVTPNYVFNFALANETGRQLPRPLAIEPQGRAAASDWAWLRAGIAGTPGIRPSEHHAMATRGQPTPPLPAVDCPSE